MRGLKTLVALITGKAIVITQADNNRADVVIGKSLTKQFVMSSLVGVCRALAV